RSCAEADRHPRSPLTAWRDGHPTLRSDGASWTLGRPPRMWLYACSSSFSGATHDTACAGPSMLTGEQARRLATLESDSFSFPYRPELSFRPNGCRRSRDERVRWARSAAGRTGALAGGRYGHGALVGYRVAGRA